jgi:two-component system OmpR family sensor kinase
MNRLFFRFFVLVMLSIAGATFLLYFALNRLFGDPLEDIARRQASAQIFLLEQYVDQAPTDEWLGRLNKVREVSKVQLDLVPLDAARQALPARQRAAFERGEVVVLPAEKAFFRRVDLKGNAYVGSDEEAIKASGLPIDIGLALKMEVVRFVVVALALLVPIALWSRRHWMGLQALSGVADRVGAGDLAARAHFAPRDSIYPLAERFNAMAARIDQLLAAQRNLMHSVSHELRTPIARLQFAMELLRDRIDDPKLEQRVTDMEADVQELDALVNELLGMTRLDAGERLTLERFDVAEAARGCVERLPPAQVPVTLDLPAQPLELEGDARLLMRALSNLLRNARKYAAAQVRLSVQAHSGGVQLIVDDDGPGIPAEERARIFEPFYRLDRSRDRATGGFGLGLAIAQRAIALHHGSIGVDTAPLGGARFIIALPLKQGPGHETAGTARQEAGSPGLA